MSVGGFDLIIDKGVKIVQEKSSHYTGLLGAKNERNKVMKDIIRKCIGRKLQAEQNRDN